MDLTEKKQVTDNRYEYLLRKLVKANDVSPAFATKIDRQVMPQVPRHRC